MDRMSVIFRQWWQCTGVFSSHSGNKKKISLFLSFYTFEITQCRGCFWTGSSPSICWSQSWSWLVSEHVCIFWNLVFRMPTSGATSHWGTSRWLPQDKHTAEMTTATPCYDGTCVDAVMRHLWQSPVDAIKTPLSFTGFFLVICNDLQSDYRAKQYNNTAELN